MNDPLISVIMPVYNAEQYLDVSLGSVQAQSYSNLQILLIDDGSTDKSLEICSRFAEEDKRIQVIHQENKGVAAARNAGLSYSAGAFLAFVDSDDFMMLDAIQIMLKAIEQSNADIVVGNYVEFQDREKNAFQQNESKLCIESISKDIAWEHLFDEEHMKYGTLWGKLFRTTLFEGIRFPEGRVYEDVCVPHILYSKSKNIVTINRTTYFYYVNPYSITHTQSEKNMMDSLAASEERTLWFWNHVDHTKHVLLSCICLHLRHSMNCYRRAQNVENKETIKRSFYKAYRMTFLKRIGWDLRKECLAFIIKER